MAAAGRTDLRYCRPADPASHPSPRQAVALMDMTPAQIGRLHAYEAMAEMCRKGSAGALSGLQHPNLDKDSQEYLNGVSDGWKDCLRGSEKLLQRLKANTP
jgi:hypothetical protein